MKKNLKRTLTAVVAGVMAVNCMALASVMQAGAAATKYEFEDGKQSAKNSVKDDDANASGGKYVFLENGGDEISDRKSTRLNSSHIQKSRMPSSA